jgi:hypothetical protein
MAQQTGLPGYYRDAITGEGYSSAYGPRNPLDQYIGPIGTDVTTLESRRRSGRYAPPKPRGVPVAKIRELGEKIKGFGKRVGGLLAATQPAVSTIKPAIGVTKRLKIKEARELARSIKEKGVAAEIKRRIAAEKEKEEARGEVITKEFMPELETTFEKGFVEGGKLYRMPSQAEQEETLSVLEENIEKRVIDTAQRGAEDDIKDIYAKRGEVTQKQVNVISRKWEKWANVRAKELAKQELDAYKRTYESQYGETWSSFQKTPEGKDFMRRWKERFYEKWDLEDMKFEGMKSRIKTTAYGLALGVVETKPTEDVVTIRKTQLGEGVPVMAGPLIASGVKLPAVAGTPIYAETGEIVDYKAPKKVGMDFAPALAWTVPFATNLGFAGGLQAVFKSPVAKLAQRGVEVYFAKELVPPLKLGETIPIFGKRRKLEIEGGKVHRKDLPPEERIIAGAFGGLSAFSLGAGIVRGAKGTRLSTRFFARERDPLLKTFERKAGKKMVIRETGKMRDMFGLRKKPYRFYETVEAIDKSAGREGVKRVGLSRLYVQKGGKFARVGLKGKLKIKGKPLSYIFEQIQPTTMTRAQIKKQARALVKSGEYLTLDEATKAIEEGMVGVRAPLRLQQYFTSEGKLLRMEQVRTKLGYEKIGTGRYRMVTTETTPIKISRWDDIQFWKKSKTATETFRLERTFYTGPTRVELQLKTTGPREYMIKQVSITPTTEYGVGTRKATQFSRVEKIIQGSDEKLKLLKNIHAEDLKRVGILKVKYLRPTTEAIYKNVKTGKFVSKPLKLKHNYARIIRSYPASEAEVSKYARGVTEGGAVLGKGTGIGVKPIMIYEVEPMSLETINIVKKTTAGVVRGTRGFVSRFVSTGTGQVTSDYVISLKKGKGFFNPLSGKVEKTIVVTDVYQPGREAMVHFGSEATAIQPFTITGKKLPKQFYISESKAIRISPDVGIKLKEVKPSFYKKWDISKDLAKKAKTEVILKEAKPGDFFYKYTTPSERYVLSVGEKWEKKQVLANVKQRMLSTKQSIGKPGIYVSGDISVYETTMKQMRVKGLNLKMVSKDLKVDFIDKKRRLIQFHHQLDPFSEPIKVIVPKGTQWDYVLKKPLSQKNLKKLLELQTMEAATPQFVPTYRQRGLASRLFKGEATILRDGQVVTTETVEQTIRDIKKMGLPLKQEKKFIDKLVEHYGPKPLPEMTAGAKQYIPPDKLAKAMKLVPKVITDSSMTKLSKFVGTKAGTRIYDTTWMGVRKMK